VLWTQAVEIGSLFSKRRSLFLKRGSVCCAKQAKKMTFWFIFSEGDSIHRHAFFFGFLFLHPVGAYTAMRFCNYITSTASVPWNALLGNDGGSGREARV
jgi:hypothetical protein